jgi:SAM-dependent methyltransferase
LSDAELSRPDADYWDAYWQAWNMAVSQEEAGARDPAPLQHWASYFERAFADAEERRLIDVACGHGPVTGVALEAAKQSSLSIELHCADYSQSAVNELLRRYPDVRGVACDARDMPFPDRYFDLVVSQFGVEYAGDDAFSEAARLVAEGGAFVALLHLAGGAIYEECADNLAVAVALREAGFMTRARDAFQIGFDLLAGAANKKAFDAADTKLAPAVETARRLIRDKGPMAAGGLLAKLYRDIGHMYSRMQNYVPGDVLAWFDGMTAELDSYEGRMASMTRAAVDAEGIRAKTERLGAAGLVVDEPALLSLAASGKPAAWILSARRPGQDSGPRSDPGRGTARSARTTGGQRCDKLCLGHDET